MTHRLTNRNTPLPFSSDAMMNAAYAWVCNTRLESGHNNSIRDLLYNETSIKPQLQKQLRHDHYFLSALPTIAKACLEKHRAKSAQHYAQGASPACIGVYVARWT